MDQAELLARVVDAFRAAGAAYTMTGSQRSIAYGEARFTHDIDVLTDLPHGALPVLLSHFPPDEFYVTDICKAVTDRLDETGSSA